MLYHYDDAGIEKPCIAKNQCPYDSQHRKNYKDRSRHHGYESAAECRAAWNDRRNKARKEKYVFIAKRSLKKSPGEYLRAIKDRAPNTFAGMVLNTLDKYGFDISDTSRDGKRGVNRGVEALLAAFNPEAKTFQNYRVRDALKECARVYQASGRVRPSLADRNMKRDSKGRKSATIFNLTQH